MNIYFDTEFTGLHQDTHLLSIGMIDENHRVLYVEKMITEKEVSQITEWIHRNVIHNFEQYNFALHEQLMYYKSSRDARTHVVRTNASDEELKDAMEEYLKPYSDVQLVSDVCHYDMVLFIDIFGTAFDLPKNVNASCHDINQDIASYYHITEREAFDRSREEILSDLGKSVPLIGKHNSLYDAFVIKEIYDAIHTTDYLL